MPNANDLSHPLPTPNSEQEYVNGVADDGSPLKILSSNLIKPRGEKEPVPPVGQRDDTPKSKHHIEAANQVLKAEQEHIERVRECVEAMRGAVALAEPARRILAMEAEIALADREIELVTKRRHLERLKAAPIDEMIEGEVDTGAPAGPRNLAHGEAVGSVHQNEHRPGGAEGHDCEIAPAPLRGADSSAHSDPMACGHGPDSDGTSGASTAKQRTRSRAAPGRHEPEGCEATSRGARSTHRRDGDATREPREPSAPMIKFSAATLMMLALRAAKELPKLSAELRDLEAKLRPAEADAKLREDFFQDKGVSVVCDTLKCMDKAYGDLGFGYWMPFRYPDQWLMFGGLLQRVLAAHGLMPSGNAAIYRKLMEETPSISPIAKDAGPPKSWGLSYRMRELKDMKQMMERIEDVRAGRGPPL